MDVVHSVRISVRDSVRVIVILEVGRLFKKVYKLAFI